jgi:hypothetical protein
MNVPSTHTHPAEFVRALSASHMITTSVLFNSGRAFGTLFGMSMNPVTCFRIVFTLFEPCFNYIARTRSMFTVVTAEADVMT